MDIHDTRLLSQPAVGPTHIAFAYAGDLWVAKRDGTGARRLTTHVGVESNPRFSPDGRLIAFSGEYDGNTDVFVVPAEGGVPLRLTWHPGADMVQAFTPDGSAILFTSGRTSFSGRFQQLFLVPAEGGIPEQLPVPNAYKATFSPDGSHIAYTPLYEAFNGWKNYRGGTVSRIWLRGRLLEGSADAPHLRRSIRKERGLDDTLGRRCALARRMSSTTLSSPSWMDWRRWQRRGTRSSASSWMSSRRSTGSVESRRSGVFGEPSSTTSGSVTYSQARTPPSSGP